MFVPLCGTVPAIAEQQLIAGQWANVGPAAACANGPPAVALAPHDSWQLNKFFEPGIRRLMVGAAAESALAAIAVSTSAPFAVK